MSIKICIAETNKELNKIYNSKNIDGDLVCLPINLETYLFCLDKNIKFLKPENFFTNDSHKKILEEAENFVDSIELNEENSDTLNLEIKFSLRLRFYSVSFILEMIKNIKKKYKISSLVVCESNLKNHVIHSPILYDIISIIFNEIKIEKVSNEIYEKEFDYNYTYEINLSTKNDKQNILTNNFGYNFKRIYFSKAFNLNYIFYTFEYGKTSFFKKILLKFLRINIIKYKKKTQVYKSKNLLLI